MLKFLLICCLLIGSGFSTAQRDAESCSSDVCNLPDCRCSATDVPGDLDPSNIPQLVYLTFDDGVSVLHYENYYVNLIGLKNPDGCPIQPTYFVAHEYTDYSMVHALHAAGHEIALHSITHNPDVNYWLNLDANGYAEEFGGEREIVSHFAAIDIEELQGIRVPFLQMSGESNYQMVKDVGMTYDCTWPTQTQVNPGLWPYTLDYKSTQDCSTGPCPVESVPGVWVVPMLDWKDNGNVSCSMTDACVNVGNTTAELVAFMKTNFERSYNGNKAPFGFFVHAAWFDGKAERFEAYMEFVNYINGLPDVYIVGPKRAIDWLKNPQPLDNLSAAWPECQPNYEPTCNKKTCEVPNADNTLHYWFSHCASDCPQVYPWLGNPLGEVK